MLTVIKSSFPIQDRKLSIVLLSEEDKEWYLGNLKRKYFSEYLDYKYDCSLDTSVNTYIQKIIDKSVEETQEIRTILKLNTMCIGGCTISKLQNGLELAYFIVPEMQHRGLGYKMLQMILDKLRSLKQTNVFVKIQEENKASIRLVERLHFKEYSQEQGKTCRNVIYKWEPRKVRLNKYTNIKMLYRGKCVTHKCVYVEKLYDIVPVYKSDTANSIQVIRFATDEIIVLVNSDLYNTLKRYDECKSTHLKDIEITYSLLKEHYGSNEKIDICLGYWFGFTPIIDMIKQGGLGEYSKERIEKLEDELLKHNIKVTHIKDFLCSIEVIEVI